MRLSIAALAAFTATVQAFRDTSPFLLFSSSPLPTPLISLSNSQLQLSDALIKETQAHIETCMSSSYYVIHQPSLSAHDVSADTFPFLSKHLSSTNSASRAVVSDVKGLDTATYESLVESAKSCGEERVQTLRLEGAMPVQREDRDEVLRNHDAHISTLLRSLSSSNTYTVIFISSPLNLTLPHSPINTISKPQEQKEVGSFYTPEFAQEAVRMDLKRDIRARAADGRIPEKTVQTDFRPLFETYQFLTPGLFMGITVGILLLSILGVGLNAISSLQVSYGAFEKEMGPAAQRKQQ